WDVEPNADLQLYAYDEEWPIGGGFVTNADEIWWDESGAYARIVSHPLSAGSYTLLVHTDDTWWWDYRGYYQQADYSLSVSAVPEPGRLLLELSALGSLAVAYFVAAKRRT
ncbi:MAG: hypothetical protein JRG96_19080, partial [Deltaproteobacteria bacterium]|nr:hypothetical protein [Deltaproteobacteria bacterium]